MKLAEALITRAGYNQRYHELKARLLKSVKTQEGIDPPESPAELMDELQQLIQDRLEIIQQINRTNVATTVKEGMTLADAIVKRDSLNLLRGLWKSAAEDAVPGHDRYSRSEIRQVSTIDVAHYQKQVDRLSRELRELDTQIQAMNWTIDLTA